MKNLFTFDKISNLQYETYLYLKVLIKMSVFVTVGTKYSRMDQVTFVEDRL